MNATKALLKAYNAIVLDSVDIDDALLLDKESIVIIGQGRHFQRPGYIDPKCVTFLISDRADVTALTIKIDRASSIGCIFDMARIQVLHSLALLREVDRALYKEKRLIVMFFNANPQDRALLEQSFYELGWKYCVEGKDIVYAHRVR